MSNSKYKICSKCIMDTADPDIHFDSAGICNHCKIYKEKVANELIKKDIKKKCLDELIKKIKTQTNTYDCLIGVSGGVDSSYVSLIAKDLGLNALLVHMDNGWNSDIAVKNIKNISKNTGFDLFTYVINWQEFKDVQISLFKASVVDIELATDHAIKAVLFRTAFKHKIKYLFNGGNVVTEAIMPEKWRHIKVDKSNLLDIHRRYGKVKLKTYPTAGIIKQQLYKYFLGLKNIKILNYVEFDKGQIIKRLEHELEWVNYGGKHHESIFTRFYQGYILPNKFNIDKRKSHYSNLINAGQLKREEALNLMKKPPYGKKLMESDFNFLLKKLNFKKDDFIKYINSPKIDHSFYKTDVDFINWLTKIRKFIRGN